MTTRFAALCLGLVLSGGVGAAPFSRPDQQGQRLMDAGQPADAATHFRSPQHRARALFDAGDTAAAMQLWSEIGDAHSEYNLGTTLTQSGAYQQAIEAFDRAAALPETPAGNAVNRDIAEQLLALAEAEQQGQGDDSQPPEPSGSQGESAPQDSESAEPGDPGTGEDEQQRDSASAMEPEQTPEQPAESASEPQQQADRESQQAAEQLLSRVPDDPAGLLRARIVREHERRHGNAGHAEVPW